MADIFDVTIIFYLKNFVKYLIYLFFGLYPKSTPL